MSHNFQCQSIALICFSGTAWSLNLVVKVTDGQGHSLSAYTPRSDFFITINRLPHLLLEVCSDQSMGRDRRRMLLQASCLVRLGNALLADKLPTFFVKAIYIDRDYHAVEYTLFQRRSEPRGKVRLLFIIVWQEVLKYTAGRIFTEALRSVQQAQPVYPRFSPLQPPSLTQCSECKNFLHSADCCDIVHPGGYPVLSKGYGKTLP